MSRPQTKESISLSDAPWGNSATGRCGIANRSGYSLWNWIISWRFRSEKPLISGISFLRSTANRRNRPLPQPSNPWRLATMWPMPKAPQTSLRPVPTVRCEGFIRDHGDAAFGIKLPYRFSRTNTGDAVSQNYILHNITSSTRLSAGNTWLSHRIFLTTCCRECKVSDAMPTGIHNRQSSQSPWRIYLLINWRFTDLWPSKNCWNINWCHCFQTFAASRLLLKNRIFFILLILFALLFVMAEFKKLVLVGPLLAKLLA